MRDAVGGTFIIYVLLIFLSIFITFTAVALNYAKAFRVKNKIIDIIEQNEGFDKDNNSEGSTRNDILKYFNKIGYSLNSINYDKFCDGYDFHDEGYCIDKQDFVSSSDDLIISEYYKVITFVNLKFPFLNLGFTFPIKGETRKIERVIV